MDVDDHLEAAYESRFGQDEVDEHYEGMASALSDCPTAFECADWCPAPSDNNATRCYNCCHEYVNDGPCQEDKDGKYCSMVGSDGQS